MYPTFFFPWQPNFPVIYPHLFSPMTSLILTCFFCYWSSYHTAVSIHPGGGWGWVDSLGPHMNPRYHCDVHPVRWSRDHGLHRRPTSHHGCIRFLLVLYSYFSTCNSRNIDLLHRTSAIKCRRWPCSLNCSGLEIGYNPISPVHGGVCVNAISCGRTLLQSVIWCKILCHAIPLGACGPPGTQGEINPENSPLPVVGGPCLYSALTPSYSSIPTFHHSLISSSRLPYYP